MIDRDRIDMRSILNGEPREEQIREKYTKDELEEILLEMEGRMEELQEKYGVEHPDDIYIPLDSREPGDELFEDIRSEWANLASNYEKIKAIVAYKEYRQESKNQ